MVNLDTEAAVKKGKPLCISVAAHGFARKDIPYLSKLTTPLNCGEDSYCISKTFDDETVLGVADGVSSWSEVNINPALFAQTLMQNVSDIAAYSTTETDPKSILCSAYTKLVENSRIDDGKPKPYGSSTACVVMINKLTGRLRFANIGDSKFMILSPYVSDTYKIKYKSKPKQFCFNCPHQITLDPALERLNKSTDETHLIVTDESINKKLFVETGDIVLVMTDGVTDNMFDKEILELISKSQKSFAKQNPRYSAAYVAIDAYKFSKEKLRDCPFSRGRGSPGGKLDDITVIAAFVE